VFTALRQRQIVISRLYKPLLPFFTLLIRARPQKNLSSIIPRQTTHSITACSHLPAMLRIRTALRPRLLERLRRRLESVIEAVVGTGLMDWVPLFFMMVMMVWIMAFPIARYMLQQMQIRLFTRVGGIRKIIVLTLASMSVYIIPMGITPTMDT
jgi:hypothetical protein